MKRGVIRIRQEFDVELPWHRYTGSWQPDPDAAPDRFRSEEGPGWNDLREAIRWARARAPVVYVRLGEARRDIYNAGEHDGADRPHPPRLRGAPRRRAARRVADHAGVDYLGEEFPSYIPAERFTASRTDLDGHALENGRRVFEQLDPAIDWAREEAAIVLVALAPNGWSHVPNYEIWSAGEEDPPGERLPRLRPRAGEDDLQWELRAQIARPPGRPVDDYCDELQAALRGDPDVTVARCARSSRPPQLSSLPQIQSTNELSADQLDALDASRRKPRDDAWVDVTVRVGAATRDSGWTTAMMAIARAQAALGQPYGGWSSHGDIRQVD